MKKSSIARFSLALALAAVASACQTVHTTNAGAVGVDRSQMMMVSEREVEQASGQQYDEVIADARRKGTLNRDPAQVERVRAISTRLIAQAVAFREDSRRWQWEVNVISSDELNAWCMAGGKMAVYSGLIDQLRLTDAELAAVMGHEIAHALREHVREQISRQMAANMGISVAGALLGVGELGQDLMGMVGKVTFQLPNSRLHETEADRIGVELAARAGYDPHAAVSLWDKMSAKANGSPPQWLSTHPAHETRRRDLAEYAERVEPLYERARH